MAKSKFSVIFLPVSTLFHNFVLPCADGSKLNFNFEKYAMPSERKFNSSLFSKHFGQSSVYLDVEILNNS